MKKHLMTFAVAGIVLALGLQPATAQVKLPPASSSQTVTQTLGIGTVTLAYFRPNANGRKVFGELVPFDQVWRTGANGIPKLTFDSNVTIGGRELAAGTYGLLTIPGTKEWTIIFTQNSEQWGAYTYKQDDDVFRFTVKPEKLGDHMETFTMAFSDVKPQSAKLNISWEKTKVSFDLTVNQDATIMASIDEAMKGEKKPYLQAAQYYYNNNKDIQKALEWVNAADSGPNSPPYIKYWKARVQLKAGDKQGAIATATQGVEIATQQNNPEYIKLNSQVLAEAKK